MVLCGHCHFEIDSEMQLVLRSPLPVMTAVHCDGGFSFASHQCDALATMIKVRWDQRCAECISYDIHKASIGQDLPQGGLHGLPNWTNKCGIIVPLTSVE